ncbi:MAG TPA: hypothetical protein VES20_23400, partial [Bryobacteraceae bacterium]|nr:hypothetical protein [Bryobacteraceae bacterium]
MREGQTGRSIACIAFSNRISGAISNLGRKVSEQTVGNALGEAWDHAGPGTESDDGVENFIAAHMATEEWMQQVARNLTNADAGVVRRHRCLLQDRDTKFCGRFQSVLRAG